MKGEEGMAAVREAAVQFLVVEVMRIHLIIQTELGMNINKCRGGFGTRPYMSYKWK